MKIKSKIVLLLLTGFFLIGILLTFSSLFILKQSNNSNIDSFQNEMIEHTNELVANNAKLFFELVDAHFIARDFSKLELMNLLEDVDPKGRNIIVVDKEVSDVFAKYRRQELIDSLNDERADFYWQEMLTTQKKNFIVDNYHELFATSTSNVEPVRMHLRVFPDHRLILGFGKVLSILKIRLKYLQQKERKSFQRSILLSIGLGFLVLTVTSAIVFKSINYLLVHPLDRLYRTVLETQKGNLEATEMYWSGRFTGNKK